MRAVPPPLTLRPLPSPPSLSREETPQGAWIRGKVIEGSAKPLLMTFQVRGQQASIPALHTSILTHCPLSTSPSGL